MPTPTTTISLAEICQYLYTVNNEELEIFNNGSINPRINVQLYMERKALQYGINQSLSGLSGVNNYVYTLLGSQLQNANEVLATGSGGVVVPPSGGSGSGLIPYPINVTVTLSQSGTSILQNSAWIGLQDINQLVVNQSVYQVGAGFTFSTITGSFDLSLSGYIFQTGDVVTALGFR